MDLEAVPLPQAVKDAFVAACLRKLQAVAALQEHVVSAGGAEDDCAAYLKILAEYEAAASKAYAEKKTRAFQADFDAKLGELSAEQARLRDGVAAQLGSLPADAAAAAVAAPALRRLERSVAAVAGGALAARREQLGALADEVAAVPERVATVVARMGSIREAAAQLQAKGVAGMAPEDMELAWRGLLDRVAENPLDVVVGYADETLDAVREILESEINRETAEQERLMSLLGDDDDSMVAPDVEMGSPPPASPAAAPAAPEDKENNAMPGMTPGKRNNSTGSVFPERKPRWSTESSSSGTASAAASDDGGWTGAAGDDVLDEIFGENAGNPNTERAGGDEDIAQKRFSIALEKERSMRKRNMKRVEREGVKKRQRLQQWKQARERANKLMAGRRVPPGGARPVVGAPSAGSSAGSAADRRTGAAASARRPRARAGSR